jgi:FMN phosphatase YigB (HAD superfamily)
MSAGPIAGVLFDFGHTLFTHDAGPDVVRTEALGLGVDLAAEDAAAVWAEIDAAAMAPAEVARGRDLDDAVWRERWSVLYGLADRVVDGLGAAIDRSFHDPWAWVPYPDTEPVLRGLDAAGLAVGVLSNTGWDVRGPFRVRDLDGLVRTFTLSYECGVAKPDERIFHAACSSLDLEPAQVLMVGDDPVADAGALTAGLAGLVLVDADAPATADRDLVARLDPARLA